MSVKLFSSTSIIVLHKYGCLLGVWKCQINPYGGLVHIKVWQQSCCCCYSCFFAQTFILFFLVHPAIVMFYLEHMTLSFVSVIFFLVFCSMNNDRWTTLKLETKLETKLG